MRNGIAAYSRHMVNMAASLFSSLIRAYRRARLIQAAAVCRVEALRHVTEKEGAGMLSYECVIGASARWRDQRNTWLASATLTRSAASSGRRKPSVTARAAIELKRQ